ncbi:SNF2-related protein [Thermoanaerobacterium sp. R66]|uniref:SNF2-related protein n=1 Tax=Thermoanaerobacterium sp. R66 TaxID=2742479 RepID=UPI002380B2A6|nr:SNF2-related protein [Thermoanaerobacterium sp. R66]MDE4542418.1 DEAD/DEAH box helicase family protein [Thermoanaerobacterium sp. R66]
MITEYHAKYYANELIRRAAPGDIDKISSALFDAAVDINPHQIEAALFAFKSPLSKGVILADEVGLGKTIEAGLVLCQYWAERKRRLLVICPASLRKQWSLELREKFNLPNMILETKNYNQEKKMGKDMPFEQDSIVITSFNFASSKKTDLKSVQWNLVVIDEAHKLRNVYRTSNRIGQNLKWALEDRKKLLLTATPLQNSLLELYGLSTLISDHIFGDIKAFRENYVNEGNLQELKERLNAFCKRTLRSHVLEYIRYTERHPFTQKFRTTDEEQELYEAISAFLQREDTYSIPKSQRNLITLILRKLLASSSRAIEQTLATIRGRLLDIKKGIIRNLNLEDLLDEDQAIVAEEDKDELEMNEEITEKTENCNENIDLKKIDAEIAEIEKFISMARKIRVDTKSKALLKALEVGFRKMEELGARRKALIFTESRRTQDYLKQFLEANGYKGKIVLFNGSNSDKESMEIYREWCKKNEGTGRISGSSVADKRVALVEYFRDHAEIMLATESAAEGVNLQFCSLVVNYDLPWNPQRIEQRIGRCHRYGQQYDVVVINFLNERNEADCRVYQLLEEKFNLFNGVFGASDAVLGSIESGVDFERKILKIYQQCRTPKEIDEAFKVLQAEMEEKIKSKMDKARTLLLENFDEDVHQKLKFGFETTSSRLDRFEKMFWQLTKFILKDLAVFNDNVLSFYLKKPYENLGEAGMYYLISKKRKDVEGRNVYRISHPLGEHVIETGLKLSTSQAKVRFDITNHPVKITVVEQLKGQMGYMILTKLTIQSFDKEEYLLFSGFASSGKMLDQEICEKIMMCQGQVAEIKDLPDVIVKRLQQESERFCEATVSRVMEANNKFFTEEQERLQKWADDLIQSSEKELEDIKVRLRELSRQARLATTTEEQYKMQLQIAELEKRKQAKRRRIFEVEDEILEKRDALIKELEMKMMQKVEKETIFMIEWEIV